MPRRMRIRRGGIAYHVLNRWAGGVRLSSADPYEIRNPERAVVMRSRLFVARPRTDRYGLTASN